MPKTIRIVVVIIVGIFSFIGMFSLIEEDFEKRKPEFVILSIIITVILMIPIERYIKNFVKKQSRMDDE